MILFCYLYFVYISMIHKNKRTVVAKISSIQKKSLIMRNLLTSFVKNENLTTTTKKAFLLKSMSDKFFSRLVSLYSKLEEKDARREAIRYVKSLIFGNNEWKKVVNELLPRLISSKKNSWFVSSYKLWQRKWDWAEEVLLKIKLD